MVLVNTQAEKLFEYSTNELCGQPVEILLSPHERDLPAGERAVYFTHPHNRTLSVGREVYGFRKDGTEFPVEVSLSPIEMDEGKFSMSAICDITERKKAEQKFRGLLEESIESLSLNPDTVMDTWLYLAEGGKNSHSQRIRRARQVCQSFTGWRLPLS
jgi:PAS domain S-box-containing protein